MCSGGRWFLSGSYEWALQVVWFDRVRLVCRCVPCVSLGSFGFVWFVRVRPWGRSVRSGSSGSSWFTIGIAGFRLVCSGAPWVVSMRPGIVCVCPGSPCGWAMVVVECDQVRLVRLGAPWVWLGSFGFVCVRPWYRSGSYGCALGVAGLLLLCLDRSCAPCW